MPILSEERLETLKILYPWYKEEVYRRREQMMRLTAFASAFLVLLLVTMLAVPAQPHPDVTHKLFAISGVALFCGVFAYLILQQRNRHRMAKQALIEIERAMGLFEDGFYVEGKPLYPEEWQTSWLGDRSIVVYLTVLATLTVLVIASVLARP
jgi:protein-S-isoprenylcysteine O-methyltransferase Ste14